MRSRLNNQVVVKLDPPTGFYQKSGKPIPYEITCSVGRRVARIYTGAPHGPTANEDKDFLVPRPAAGIL